MSEIKVNSIKGVGASAAAITVNNSDGTCTANITNNLSNRNKIINGDFTIHQRGGTITPSGGTYTLDRWRTYIAGSATGGLTVQQSTGSYPQTNISGVKDNFKASALITVTSAGSAASDNNVKFQQRIEGSNIYDLALGTVAAKTFTVSFYVKCSLTGTFGASLVNSGHDRSNIQTYTINSANTWEYKTFTVTGDTSGSWNTNTGTGLQLMFDLGSGSSYLSDSTNQWLSGEYHGTTSSVKLTHTNGATIQFAGVQLESGSVATDFEHRSFGQELQLCKRYYQQINQESSSTSILTAFGNGSGRLRGLIYLPVEMRANPTVALDVNGGNPTFYSYTGGNPSYSSLSGVESTKKNIVVDINTSTLTAGAPYDWRGSDAFITITAEL